ncbi:FadR/GntR family transcriptional regulator [Nocardioides sp. Arc9.136]|uniref:FadR/GntR family transcriptional regulator n=1 Tax=Nocardioides sp. Arc9.136 TaxID=2996826 RepID=UPI0026657EDE|nr:FCD domain-containing protein [Nocardioides sp. Arc9.136]WKN46929.1 FCD domain-containing protein [Nocardioides sp. Arc9.136]
MAVQFYGRASAAVFSPLESKSRSELVSRRLTDAIALGLLPDAEQLPGETDLAGIFGVSTVTVREALSVLRAEGLIETRRGRGGGSFVRTPEGGVVELARRRLDGFSLSELRDLGDVYAAISGASAALAARRSSAEDLDRLRRVADTLATATAPDARRRADAHFHVEVAAAAQSPQLYHEEVRLQAEFGTLLWIAFGDDSSHEQMVRSCRAVVDSIANRDPRAAREAAEQRVADSTARLIDYRLNRDRR